MAKKANVQEEGNVEEERNVKVQARVNLKYDSDVIKADKEFNIRKSDIESMKPYVEVIDIPEDTPKDAAGEKNDGQQDTKPPVK